MNDDEPHTKILENLERRQFERDCRNEGLNREKPQWRTAKARTGSRGGQKSLVRAPPAEE